MEAIPRGIEIVDCQGNDPRELGVSLGENLRRQISAADEALGSYETFRMHQPWWLPYSVYRYMAESRARSTLESPIAATFPEMTTRIQGMADGAQTRIETLYLYHALEAMLTSTDSLLDEAPPLVACTAVALSRSRTNTGEPMLHHNFDNVPLLKPLAVMRNMHQPRRFRSLEFTMAPLAGAIDGINEHGLCITYNFAWTTQPGPPAPPVSMAISETLARCRTVTQAIRFLKSRPRCGGSMLMLGDGYGDLARVEFAGDRTCVRYPDNDALFHTNTYHSPTMKSAEVGREARYPQTAPEALRGERVLQSAERRDARLEQLLASDERFTDQDLSRVMSDHGADGSPDGDSVCMHGDYWETLTSLQFFPRRRMVRVACGSPCREEFEEIYL